MGQEFFIKSQNLEQKVRELLPSQGNLGAGQDLSASTQIIPIVDLTESAEGSNVRADLQTAFGINCEIDQINNTTTTIINTTGYFRLLGLYKSVGTTTTNASIQITDGITTKKIQNFSTTVTGTTIPFDFNIFLSAGDSCVVTSASNGIINVASRQIATIDGTLVNP